MNEHIKTQGTYAHARTHEAAAAAPEIADSCQYKCLNIMPSEIHPFHLKFMVPLSLLLLATGGSFSLLSLSLILTFLLGFFHFRSNFASYYRHAYHHFQDVYVSSASSVLFFFLLVKPYFSFYFVPTSHLNAYLILYVFKHTCKEGEHSKQKKTVYREIHVI